MARILPAAVLAMAPVVTAQTWEAGGAAAAGFYNHQAVSSAAGRAEAGLGRGPVVSGFFAHNLYRNVGAEIRYTFQPNDLELSSGGKRVTFRGLSHAVHYDCVVYVRPRESLLRPFLAGGAGFKQYRGTGRESAWQPLGNFALLTRTQEWQPLVSVGAGLKFVLGPGLAARVEFRDYLTPFPRTVIAPAPGARVGGWLHAIVPLAGFSFSF